VPELLHNIVLVTPAMSESQKRFLLYAAPTPNGYPISAFLEELKAIYPGIDYECVFMS
jgi:hypothetical protein